MGRKSNPDRPPELMTTVTIRVTKECKKQLQYLSTMTKEPISHMVEKWTADAVAELSKKMIDGEFRFDTLDLKKPDSKK